WAIGAARRPPSKVINLRRVIRSPRRRGHAAHDQAAILPPINVMNSLHLTGYPLRLGPYLTTHRRSRSRHSKIRNSCPRHMLRCAEVSQPIDAMVNRDRVEPVAGPAMSALIPKGATTVSRRYVAMGRLCSLIPGLSVKLSVTVLARLTVLSAVE